MGSWQGSGATSAEQIDAIVRASGVRTRPLKQARDWGYQRLVASKVVVLADAAPPPIARVTEAGCASTLARSEEHTSELQSLMRISYAVFCLKKKKPTHTYQ